MQGKELQQVEEPVRGKELQETQEPAQVEEETAQM